MSSGPTMLPDSIVMRYFFGNDRQSSRWPRASNATTCQGMGNRSQSSACALYINRKERNKINKPPAWRLLSTLDARCSMDLSLAWPGLSRLGFGLNWSDLGWSPLYMQSTCFEAGAGRHLHVQVAFLVVRIQHIQHTTCLHFCTNLIFCQ